MSKEVQKSLTLAGIAERIGGAVVGDGSVEVGSVNSIGDAGVGEITFVTSDEHVLLLGKSGASAVIVSAVIEGAGITQLVVDNVQKALIEVLELFAPRLRPTWGVHPAALVEKNAEIGSDVCIGPGAYIGHNVRLGDGAVVSAGCCIGENSDIGANTRLDANVVVYHGCKIGANCVIQANCTIGGSGFGYYPVDGRPRLIPHNGSVIIEDDVEIGAGCCIDRAKFGNTVVGAGTKMDNMVQVGHNVVIGKCCLLVSQVAIGGSCRLGDGVVVGGQAGVDDHVTIGDGAMVGGGSGVTHDVEAGQKLFGTPATSFRETSRRHAMIKRLPEMGRQLKEVLKRVEQIEKGGQRD